MRPLTILLAVAASGGPFLATVASPSRRDWIGSNQEIGIAPSLDDLESERRWLQQKYTSEILINNTECSLGVSRGRKRQSKLWRRRYKFAKHMAGIDLQVGTPPQTIRVLLDTGASGLVIPLSLCTTCAGTLFRSDDSISFMDAHVPVTMKYEDQCSFVGIRAYDAIRYDNLPLFTYPFAAITEEVKGSLRVAGNSGFLGLGPRHTASRPSFFHRLMEKGVLEEPVLSLYTANPRADGTRQSEQCVGCINTSKIQSGSRASIQYYPIKEDSPYWNLENAALYVDGHQVTVGFDATVDSGTDMITLPSMIYDQFFLAIPGAKDLGRNSNWAIFPCDTALPRISLGFGYTDDLKLHDIDLQHFNLGRVPNPTGGKKYDGLCVAAVTRSTSHEAILGGPFLKSWYTIFDFGRLRVGFAKPTPAKEDA